MRQHFFQSSLDSLQICTLQALSSGVSTISPIRLQRLTALVPIKIESDKEQDVCRGGNIERSWETQDRGYLAPTPQVMRLHFVHKYQTRKRLG